MRADRWQATGMISDEADYRIAALVSGAGALLLVSGFVNLGLDQQHAYGATYVAMAALIVVGLIGSLVAVAAPAFPPARPEHTGSGGKRHVWVGLLDPKSCLLPRCVAR